MLNTLINDSRRQMRFTAAAGTAQHQPAFRFGGKSLGGMESLREAFLTALVAASAFRYKVFKGKTGQGTQVAVFLQPGLALGIILPFDTLTWNYTAIIQPS